MLLEIKKYPDPILKKKCIKVREITEEIRKIIQDMTEIMQKKEGIGLAAPQVGILKKIIAVQAGENPVILINPKILKKSKEVEVIEEGCLSFPGIFLNIKRPREVEVEGVDINFKKFQIKAKGILARVLQHEIDHLDGILFIARLGILEKMRIKSKLKR